MKQFARVVVRSPDQRFLILRERGRPWWNFPGGKVEEGESPIDAACRELLEEVELSVEPTELEFINSGSFKIVGTSWEGFFYFAHCVRGNAWPRETENAIDLSWSALEELTALSTPSGLLGDVARAVHFRGLLTRTIKR